MLYPEEVTNMRIGKESVSNLQKVKNKMVKENLTIFDISNCEAVDFLYEYFVDNSPSKLLDRKEELLRDYVPSETFDTFYAESAKSESKLDKEILELSSKLKDNDSISNSQITKLTKELLELKDTEETFKIELFNLKNKVSKQIKSNDELTQQLHDNNEKLSKLQKEHDILFSAYNNNCLDVECLVLLSKICRFLMNNPRKKFTAESLANYFSVSMVAIKEAIGFINYGIFPIEREIRQGGTMYSFDKRFKKRF